MNLTEDKKEKYSAFTTKMVEIEKALKPYARESEKEALSEVINKFQAQVEDFYRKDRQLNIGIIGQVKAGKSSFLNTLLFAGRELLPKAATPKTATLTKMEYSDTNRIVVTYYSDEDWKKIEKDAKRDDDKPASVAARELLTMVQANGIIPADYTSRGTDEYMYESYEALAGELNKFVGADGLYTPLVKSVTLYINKKEFKGLTIVDTPGLNDPIMSRTQQTRDFMKVCDVVFFLCQSGAFLEKADWALVSEQLPEEGVKKLVLVASKFDSGLRSVLRPKTEEDEIFGSSDSIAHDIPTAIDLVTKKLRRMAGARIDEYMNELERRGVSEQLKHIVEDCRHPIMVSTMAENMSNKDVDAYSSEEMNVYRALSQYSADLKSDLKAIGNFKEIYQVFSAVFAEKEAVLADKERTLVETAKAGVKNLLYKATEKAKTHIRVLDLQDREQLQVQRQQLESQRNAITAEVASAFSKLFSLMEENKLAGIKAIRDGAGKNVEIRERTGTTTHVRSYTVSDSTWYKPWTWFDSHTEYYTYEESYTYCLAADAIEKLSKYASQGCTQAGNAFMASLKLKSLKSELINIVLNHFDTGDVNFDSSFFRLLVEEKVEALPIPVFSLDITSQINRITSDFSGEITSSSGRSQLQQAVSSALITIAEALANQLDSEVQKFRAAMEQRAQLVKTELVKTLVDALEELERQCDAKEAEVKRQKEYIALLEKFSAELV